ncbi:MAG: hypothetical protein ACR2N2_04420 [Acidimicrobiia bacterium]
MTDKQNDKTDYSDLMRSPYDPDPATPDREEGSSDLSWKAPVAAAVLGALIVSALVVYAAATGNEAATGDDATETTVTTTPAAPEQQQSSELPVGYSPLDEEVGARVEAVDVSATALTFGLTTAVVGGVDAAEVPPPDVAYWELLLGDEASQMLRQYGQTGTLGNITIEFPPIAAIRDASLSAHLAIGAVVTEAELLLEATVPQQVNGYRIELGDENAVFIESLDIGDGWGHVSWTVEGDLPAKVDTIVTFVGTDDPATEDVDATVLTPPHLRTLAQGTGIRPPGPLYLFSASQPLVRSGEPLSGSNTPTSIVVSFVITTPESVSDPVPVEVPPLP